MLEDALASVAGQNWSLVEHIVIDGGSTDGTVAWLATKPELTLITGPDQGIYDAINKGLEIATGDVIGLLNSDDVYLPNAFEKVARVFSEHPETEIVCGEALLIDEAGGCQTLTEDVRPPAAVRTALMGVCVPNARFFRREVFAKAGTFDLSFRLIADRDLILRFVASGIATRSLGVPVYSYRRHPGSLTFDAGRSQAISLRREFLQLARKWMGKPDGSPQTRRLATVLDGRSRIGILRDGAGQLSLGGRLRPLFVDGGRPSPRPMLNAAYALADQIGSQILKRWRARRSQVGD